MMTDPDERPPNEEAPAESGPGEPEARAEKPSPGKRPARARGRRPYPRVLLALLLGLVAGRYVCAPEADRSGPGPDTPATEASIWTCSMHPQIRMPEPGKCPICFMDLVPVQGDDGADLDPGTLRMSENAVALAEIVTRPVERRSVSHQVRMVGRVTYDETLLSYITAWVPSRLNRLFVDYTGVSVRKGDHMVEVYSPNLIATQQELLQAIETEKTLGEGSVDVVKVRQAASVESARERLRLWGIEPWQIDEIVERGKPLERLTINSPASGIVIHKNALLGDWVDTGTRIYTIADLSRVWVQLDAYESDLPWLHYGQHVVFELEAWPGETFHGRISFIDPVLDDRTRTVKVRMIVDNPEMRLKPDMFVRATVAAPMSASGRMIDPELAGMWMCPMHPEVVAADQRDCDVCGMDLVPTEELGFRVAEEEELPLVIPATSPLLTGTRAVVYVRLPGTGKPTFQGREIVLGPRAGGWYLVRDGLAEGELVVVNGAFKIDSELQIRAQPSMMSPEGGRPPPGHQHGGPSPGAGEHAGHRGAAPAVEPASIDDVAPAFREQLGALVAPYLRAQEALAADDPDGARAGGHALGEALGAVDRALLEGEAHEAWVEARSALAAGARGLVEGATIAGQRDALRETSRALIGALERFGYATDGDPVAVFHCPMAFGGAGGDWLQVHHVTANPYYGEQMPRCGDRVRELAQEP